MTEAYLFFHFYPNFAAKTLKSKQNVSSPIIYPDRLPANLPYFYCSSQASAQIAYRFT